MKTEMKRFLEEKEKVTKAFLQKKSKAKKDFWCHTKESIEFYAYWDRKFNALQKYLNKRWAKVSIPYDRE